MPALVTSWDVYLDSSPHPWAPSLGQILAERFSADERQFFEGLVRPAVESGQNVEIERIAYVSARKPLGAAVHGAPLAGAPVPSAPIADAPIAGAPVPRVAG
jgi:hypothetical protein